MPKSDPDYSSPPPHESPEPINPPQPPQEDPPAGPESDAAAPERIDTAEFERHRRTMTASPPRSRTSQIGSRRASMAGGVAGGPTGPSIANPFFAVSLFLGVSSWFIALISQSMVTAKFGNSSIGTLWFAFVLQSLLLAWLFASFFSFSPTHFSRSSSNTIAHLASMTAVLASIGVNDNIFSKNATQMATAAGWLIIAIIDVLWVIYFSTEDGSGVRAALDASWSRDGVGGVTRTEADDDEEGGEPNPRRRAFTLTGKLVPLTAPSFKLKSSRLRKSRPGSTAEPKIVIEESAGENGATPLTEAEIASAIDNRRSTAGRSLSVNPGASSTGVADSRPVSSARSAAGAGGAGSTSGTGIAGNRAKAQAMYNYKGSEGDPHELTFVKGEMFEIIDQTGKWWEVVNKEGEVGIVPSNYVRVMK